jgi:hypothetical protein
MRCRRIGQAVKGNDAAAARALSARDAARRAGAEEDDESDGTIAIVVAARRGHARGRAPERCFQAEPAGPDGASTCMVGGKS